VQELAGGRYVLERPLGRGGMAVVMLGRDTALDRSVAVKLLADSVRGDRELRERFLREGRFAAQLSHPNVVAVYDTGEEDGQPYIVMEYVDGVTLADEVHRRGPLPADEVAELGRQACAGLAHAHERGVVHRDVKPQNLLLDRGGTLKVADFGIARAGDVSGTLTQAGTLLGTAAYMAPETIHGEPATASSDVYSLGAVLYELATGRAPRQVTTIADLTRDEPTPLPGAHVDGLPAQLEATIMRCLEPDPSRRPPSAAALAAELGGSPGDAPTRPLGGTISQRPTRRLQQPARHRTRSRAPLWAAAALGALVLLAVVALGGGGEPPPPARVEPVPAGSTPSEQARSLSAWLRDNAARAG